MEITPSELRRNIYRYLDTVLEKGEPLEIVRKGRRLKIIADDEPEDRFSRLVRRPLVKGDPEDIVHMDWSEYWNAGKDLE
ncbi:MAG: type II toxin-antitoxin system Phd/YefM family antitoxin [SAR324 cluster bacterium]|uniref:Type II toxin-antitoxin system Phd/YefM family antitoxin n=1 Tax=SAR324 cluster bacterium TaxID=2024889 RepID=A0A432GJA7_9DELT|nr:MAG: type II toxin-antitoxin system Phd/YefM family antitoxin [SAR324 cluster bacterium]